MGSENEEKKKLSRKDFLRLSGSIAAGGAIAGVSGKLISDMVKRPEYIFYNAEGEGYDITDGDSSVSPYRRVASFGIQDPVEAMDILGERIVAAVGGSLTVYSREGEALKGFPLGAPVRDICVSGDLIYILFASRIEVYTPEGELVRGWDACSDNSDYCSMAVSPGGVFVTDVFAKNICKYSLEGGLERFIDSPNRFVIPSYTYGIACFDGKVWCSNSGRHLVETYTENGKYLSCFGTAGTEPGRFSGCCNPVHLHITPAGELLTCEKGIPRVCCYSREGAFRSVLLNKKALGGGYDAYEARMTADGQILAAGKHNISIYRYDPALARAEGEGSACGICDNSRCPVRRG